METRTYQRRKMLVVLLMMTLLLAVLLARMWYIMVNRSQHYKNARMIFMKESGSSKRNGELFTTGMVWLWPRTSRYVRFP